MYIRLCEGLNDYGKLIPQDVNIYNFVKDTNKDYYTSVYLYNEEQKKQFDRKHSIAGITDVITNQLIFDFDSKDIELARQDTIEVVNRLAYYGILGEEINIYFSGNKGFHIVLDTNKTFTPKQSKVAASKIANGLKSFDSVVYNSNRILRLANTKHPETGLFKTNISVEELKNMPIDQIRELASEEYEVYETNKLYLEEDRYNKLFKEEKEETTENDKLLFDELNLNKKPKFLSPWKYALEQGFFPSGLRSYSLMVLASTYKGLGYNETKCYYSLKAAADLQAQRFNQEKFSKEEIYKNIISQVYGQNWQGGTYAEDNFPDQLKDYLTELGIPRQNETDIHENYVVNITKGFDSFREYAENIDANTMKFNIPDLDNVLKVQVGHLIGVLAGPGIGKTSLALTLLNNTSKEGVKSFFGSYDMAGNILVQKLLQRETRLTSDEIYDIYRNKDYEQIKNFSKILEKNYSNVSFCFKAGQTVEELRESIRKEELKMGEEIKLVIVDYLELIRTKSSDPTIASAEAIQGLREIANEGKVVVCLLQPNKMSSKPDEPLLSYNAAKGSSAIAQAVTAMITCNRPGYSSQTPENDVYFSINVVKNRMGALSQVDFSWDGPTGRIGQLEDIQKQDLAELRALKKINEGDI